ncbi:DUF2304 domain-containing protein [Georgenia sp. SYP-B2076]|uniref:DUF2304 domain-containing protein n=1 Tax=Georgenia sp. SYP-B2076 TaxID=2495881 RepID=UPI000F8F4846|nr:DUF2304 domain-containing protein [Georgenia sp. SYP-B2076]
MWIQILLLLGILGTVIPLTRTASARHQAIRRLLLVGFVVLAVFAVLFPTWLTAVANLLGVGRGTDLLLYVLVIAFLTYVASSYRHMVTLDRKLTVLTRKLALTETALLAKDGEVADEASAGAGHEAPGDAGDETPVDAGTVFDPDTAPAPRPAVRSTETTAPPR